MVTWLSSLTVQEGRNKKHATTAIKFPSISQTPNKIKWARWQLVFQLPDIHSSADLQATRSQTPNTHSAAELLKISMVFIQSAINGGCHRYSITHSWTIHLWQKQTFLHVGMMWPQSHAREIDTPRVYTAKGKENQDNQEGYPRPSSWPSKHGRQGSQHLPEKTFSYWYHDPKLWFWIHYSLWDSTSWSHAICSPKIRFDNNGPDQDHATRRRQGNNDHSFRKEEFRKITYTPTSIIHIIIHCATKLSRTPKVFFGINCQHFTQVKDITTTVKSMFCQNNVVINEIQMDKLIWEIHWDSRPFFGNIETSADLHNGTGPKSYME